MAKKKIFLIDDSADDGEILRRLLEPEYLFAHVVDEAQALDAMSVILALIAEWNIL